MDNWSRGLLFYMFCILLYKIANISKINIMYFQFKGYYYNIFIFNLNH